MIKLKINAIDYYTHKKISIIRYFECDKAFEEYVEHEHHILDGVFVPKRIFTIEMQAYDYLIELKDFSVFLDQLIHEPKKELSYIIDFEVVNANYIKEKQVKKTKKSELEQLLEIIDNINNLSVVKNDFIAIYIKTKKHLHGNIYKKLSQVLSYLDIAYKSALNAYDELKQEIDKIKLNYGNR